MSLRPDEFCRSASRRGPGAVTHPPLTSRPLTVRRLPRLSIELLCMQTAAGSPCRLGVPGQEAKWGSRLLEQRPHQLFSWDVRSPRRAGPGRGGGCWGWGAAPLPDPRHVPVSASPSMKCQPHAPRVCLSSRGQRGGRRRQTGPLEGVAGAGGPVAASSGQRLVQWSPACGAGSRGLFCGHSWSSSMLDIGAKADALGTCLGRVGPHPSVCCFSHTCVSACVHTVYHPGAGGGLRYGEPRWRLMCDPLRVLCFQT